jgi:DNA end-binding protein Ku
LRAYRSRRDRLRGDPRRARKAKAAAIARTVLFRRLRPVLIRAQGAGLIADTLEFDHDVRKAAKVFNDIAELKLDKEMLDLARHIIDTKRGKFQPERFEDRYDDALAELVKARAESEAMAKPKPTKAARPIGLIEALRTSAATKAKAKAPTKRAGSRQGRLRWRSRPTAARHPVAQSSLHRSRSLPFVA